MVTPISGFLRRLPLAWLVLATFPDSFPDRVVTSASAKKIGGPVRLAGPKKENKWRYLSKFGYDIGTGSFDFRFQLSAPKSIPEPAVIQLEVYLDEQWAEVESEPVMCDRQRYAKQVRNISIGPGANWTDWSTGTLSQSVRPHIWYFVVSDCRHTLANFTHRLKFEFHAKQANGSEFSVEMKGMLLANALFLGSFIVLMHWFIKRTLAFAKSAGYVHPVIWTLASGMITQFIAQVMHTIHLLAYKYDGDGLKACEVLSEILFMLAQVIQTSLLILIALGYTLLQSKIGELDLMIPMCFMIGVIHIMLVGFGKIKDDASYKYHENEGVIGWILLVLRLGLYGWFLWAVQSSAREGGFKIANFLQQFRIAGSLYFLAFPGIFLVTQLFAPYLQHFVMTIGQMFMQATLLLCLPRVICLVKDKSEWESRQKKTESERRKMAEILPCQIEALDGSIVSLDVAKKASGDQLLRDVYAHIGLEENDYFGLQYFDKKEQLRWLDPLKPIRKQLKNGPYNFRLRVRLYPTSPTYLFDESTRYYISLQIREDLLSKKLLCSEDTKASLYSYLVQGEFGDYDPSDHQVNYLDDFTMLEDEPQDFIDKVHILHVQNKGMLPSECDKKFLDLSCRLDRYGMDFHQIVDFSGVRLWAGVTCSGLTIFCGQEPFLTKLNHFPWVRISGVNFKNKQLLLEMSPIPAYEHQEVIGFTCVSRSSCKELWKSCVCHHSFFRTTRTERLPPPKIGLFRRGSTFRYSGRTQFKLLQDGTTTQRRSSRKFERLSSRNKIARKTI